MSDVAAQQPVQTYEAPIEAPPTFEPEAQNISTSPVLAEQTPVEEKPKFHVIGPDDTLDTIADKYGLDPVTLFSWHGGELDRQAAARGLGGSEGGRILFAGTALGLEAPAGPNGQYNPAPVAVSSASEIARFHQLLTQGIINEDDFNKAKARLIG